MSYHIYTTTAFVCGAVDQNQSDRAFLLFTESLGMVWASARSVREERSRQRYALQVFSEVTISLIRGKSGWRIGSVMPGANYYQQASTRAERVAITKLCKVARQYIHGEEVSPKLYATLLHGCQTILQSSDIDPEHVVLLFTTKMLHILGYVAAPADMTLRFNEPLVAPLQPTEISLLQDMIKNASTVSHL